MTTKINGHTVISEEVLRDVLANDCKSLKLARICMALMSVEAVYSFSAYKLVEPDPFLDLPMEMHPIPENSTIPQEAVIAKFSSPYHFHEAVAVIYELGDLVILYLMDEADDETFLEPIGTMTIQGFFQYLNTLPNMNRFLSDPQAKACFDINLLDELANYPL